MAVEPAIPVGKSLPSGQVAQGTRFPGYDLKASVDVPRLLHVQGGGRAAPESLAAYLGYKGTNNGAYLTRVASARAFGLIERSGQVFVATQLAHQIISPVYGQDAQKALVQAFLSVELFKRIYEDFKGRELPPETGMKNALRNNYGVAPGRVSEAYKSLMDSADTAGFFITRAGARTHLIIPNVEGAGTVAVSTTPSYVPGEAIDDFATAEPVRTAAVSTVASSVSDIGDVKSRYISALIKLFEEKADKGELDESLMQRIERLLGADGRSA